MAFFLPWFLCPQVGFLSHFLFWSLFGPLAICVALPILPFVVSYEAYNIPTLESHTLFALVSFLVKGFGVWVFMAFPSSLLGLTPFSFWASFNSKNNYMLVFLSLTTMVCKTFMASTITFMDNEIKTFLVWMALTLSCSNSISNQTTFLVV